ncbi:hypothetical protein [Parageobacillus toebii]|uniref:Uncharacterized protein n=1 Tax=Parageobacillus toebii TaxID=153151 RepID=A0A150N839_9BACL|nr:hypothetical protein [Parageobacillus toebii]KYD32772.1 hypothetical protein B4110_3602 [Parageobacillus toebii]
MSVLMRILYDYDVGGRGSPYLLLFFCSVVQLEHNSKYKIFILRNKLRGVGICGYWGINPVKKWISGLT